MKAILICAALCSALLYDSWNPHNGFTESCVCCENGECDKVLKTAPPAMELHLKLKQKKPDPEAYDDRPKLKYEDE